MKSRRRIMVDRVEPDRVAQPVKKLFVKTMPGENVACRRIDPPCCYSAAYLTERRSPSGSDGLVHFQLFPVRFTEAICPCDVRPKPVGVRVTMDQDKIALSQLPRPRALKRGERLIRILAGHAVSESVATLDAVELFTGVREPRTKGIRCFSFCDPRPQSGAAFAESRCSDRA